MVMAHYNSARLNAFSRILRTVFPAIQPHLRRWCPVKSYEALSIQFLVFPYSNNIALLSARSLCSQNSHLEKHAADVRLFYYHRDCSLLVSCDWRYCAEWHEFGACI